MRDLRIKQNAYESRNHRSARFHHGRDLRLGRLRQHSEDELNQRVVTPFRSNKVLPSRLLVHKSAGSVSPLRRFRDDQDLTGLDTILTVELIEVGVLDVRRHRPVFVKLVRDGREGIPPLNGILMGASRH